MGQKFTYQISLLFLQVGQFSLIPQCTGTTNHMQATQSHDSALFNENTELDSQLHSIVLANQEEPSNKDDQSETTWTFSPPIKVCITDQCQGSGDVL